MEWCKLYATLATDPKVSELSDKAFRAYIEAMCYATLHETDGQFFFRHRGVDELVRVGLVDVDQDGRRWIHSWLKRQRSIAEIEEERAAARERMRRSRSVRPNIDRSSSSSADEVPTSTSISNSSSGSVVEKQEDSNFVEFYENAYPRRQGRGAARAAWAKAIKKADPQTIIAGARRFAADPNREDAFTPHPQTWLNQERWNDDPLPSGQQSIRHHDRAAQILKGVSDGHPASDRDRGAPVRSLPA